MAARTTLVDPPSGPHLSIGAVSRATGIPTETLRTWERRYGFPAAARLGSGHRRYSVAVVERLRMVRDLVGRGHLPSTVVSLDDDALARVVAATEAGPAEASIEPAPAARSVPAVESVSSCLRLLAGGDVAGLERSLEQAWSRLEPLEFLRLRVGPLLREVGRRWKAGQLGIAEEHLLAAMLEHFLAARRREMEAASRGPRAVLATLAGEPHALGLHQAALVSSLAGWRVAFVGAGLPVEEVAHATRTLNGAAVVVSVSEFTGGRPTETAIGHLRGLLPEDIALAVGGHGAPSVPGTTRFEDFETFLPWMKRLGSMIPARAVGSSRP